jgi:hypothetical protein
MYRQDVTQALTPSTASPEGAINASRSRTAMVGTLFEGVAQQHGMYVENEVRAGEEEARNTKQQFLNTNMQAEVAAADATINNARIAELEKQNKALFLAPGEDAAPALAANLGAIEEFKAQAVRLKQASQGGMSNTEYMTRVSAITKASIAKYPGLADKIRQEVSRITGLGGADEFAANQFVRSRFKEDTTKGLDDGPLRKNDIKELALSNNTTESDIVDSYGTPKFEMYKQRHQERLSLNQQKELLETDIKSKTFAHDSQAKEYAYPAIQKMGAIAGASALMDYKSSESFKTYQESANKASSPEERLMLEQTQSEVIKTLLKGYKSQSYEMINRLVTQSKGNMSAETIKELRAEVDHQFATIESTHLDPKGTTAMLSVLTKYKEKNFQQLMQLHSVNVGMLGAMANSDLVKQYMLGGKSQEYVKVNYPEVYNTIDGLMKNVERSGGAMSALVAAGNTTGLWGAAVKDAASSPDATSATLRNKETDAIVSAKAFDVINKREAGGPISTEDVNTVSTFISNSTNGATFKAITQHWDRIEKYIATIPADQRGPMVESVSTYYQQVVNKKRVEYAQWAESNKVELGIIPNTASVYVENGTVDQKNYVKNHIAPYIYAASRARSLATGVPLAASVKATLDLYKSPTRVHGGFITQEGKGAVTEPAKKPQMQDWLTP